MAVSTSIRYIPIEYSNAGKYKTKCSSRFADGKSYKNFQTYIGHVRKLIESDLEDNEIKYNLIGVSIDISEKMIRLAYDLTGDALKIKELGFLSM